MVSVSDGRVLDRGASDPESFTIEIEGKTYPVPESARRAYER
jgi:hypothetical protein